MKIIVPLVCTLFLLGCNDTAPTEKAPSPQNSNVAVEDVNVTSANKAQAVLPTPEVTTSEVKAEPVQIESKPVEKVKTEPKKSSVPKTVQEVKPKAPEQAQQSKIDASALFGEKCASCHGSKAEKPALGKSQVIAGWSASQIEEALHGYQSGSYGKEMKALMAGQAKSLTSEQIKSLAKYISTL